MKEYFLDGIWDSVIKIICQQDVALTASMGCTLELKTIINTQEPQQVSLIIYFFKFYLDMQCICSRDGSGSKIFDPGRVSHLWFGFEFGNLPRKMSNFSIFSLRVKKNLFGSGQKVPGSKASRPLIYCGSKVSSGQGPSLICREGH